MVCPWLNLDLILKTLNLFLSRFIKRSEFQNHAFNMSVLKQLKNSTLVRFEIQNSFGQCLHLAFGLFFFFFCEKCVSTFPMGPMHCSRDPQTSFFNKIFIKNGFHDTIHIFKNYFATVFSVFSKISCIQMDPKNLLLSLCRRISWAKATKPLATLYICKT